MILWTPRTTAPAEGTPPYDWNAYTKKQCTWYAYWRVREGKLTPPVWQTGSGNSGSGLYNNAKTWLDHFRDPWERHYINDGVQPVAGDIIVFTGTYGHVCVVEEVRKSDGLMAISDYNLLGGNDNFGYKYNYKYGDRLFGPVYSTGACIGFLHYPDIVGETIMGYIIKRNNKEYVIKLV